MLTAVGRQRYLRLKKVTIDDDGSDHTNQPGLLDRERV